MPNAVKFGYCGGQSKLTSFDTTYGARTLLLALWRDICSILLNGGLSDIFHTFADTKCVQHLMIMCSIHGFSNFEEK